MEQETKTLHLELKADAEGAFRATFATLNVVDHHGDVTLPGAFAAGKEVLIGGYQHDMLQLPVGKGRIGSDGDRAWVDGQFFLDTPNGDATYRTVKNAGGLMEWSYVFIPVQTEEGPFDTGQGTVDVRFLKKIDVWSIDPVLKGAGINTRTDFVKSIEPKAVTRFADLPLAPRDHAWDSAAAEARVRAWAGAADGPTPKYARAFFWTAAGNDDDGDGVPDNFGDYKLGFADVIGGNLVAIPRAVFNCAGIMQGARGGVNMPDGDRSGVRAHIARYYDKMRQEFNDDSIVPPWQSQSAIVQQLNGQAFTVHAAEIAAATEAFVTRVRDRAAVLVKEGRVLSSANVDRIGSIAEALDAAASDLRQLVADANPSKSQDLQHEFLDYQRTLASLEGVRLTA